PQPRLTLTKTPTPQTPQTVESPQNRARRTQLDKPSRAHHHRHTRQHPRAPTSRAIPVRARPASRRSLKRPSKPVANHSKNTPAPSTRGPPHRHSGEPSGEPAQQNRPRASLNPWPSSTAPNSRPANLNSSRPGSRNRTGPNPAKANRNESPPTAST